MKNMTQMAVTSLLAGLLSTGTGWSAWTVEQSMEAGYQSVNQDNPEAKFQEYGEIPDGAIIPRYTLEAGDDRTRVDFEAKDVLQNDQSYSLSIDRDSRFSVDAGWDQTPHLYSETARTLYNETSAGVWRLPDQIQTDLQGLTGSTFINKYADYATASREMELGIQNDKGMLNLGFRANDKLRFKLGFQNEMITGKKAYGASFGFSHAVELPDTIDYQVRTLRAGTEWATSSMQLGLDYTMQAFENDIESMIWDNAKRVTDRASSSTGYINGDQSSQGRSSRAPDNTAHHASLRAGFELPAKTRFTADTTFGYMSASQDMQAYTINSAMTTAATPAAPFDASNPANTPVSTSGGRASTWAQNYRLTNRIIDPLTLAVGYRTFEHIDRTPEILFAGNARFDAVWETPAATNLTFRNKRFSFRKDALEGSADLEILKSLSAGLSYTAEWVNREHREVKETEENTLAASMDYRPMMNLLVRGAYTWADREAQDFEIEDYENDAGALIELPGLRRYDTADRIRNEGSLQAQWTPGSLSLGVNGSMGHDQYEPGVGDLTGGVGTNLAQQYGLLSGRTYQAGGDIGWQVNGWLTIDGYYQFEQVVTLQRSDDNSGGTLAQSAADSWSVEILDRYHTGGVTAGVVAIPKRLDLKVGYELSYSRGGNNFVNLGATNASERTPEETETSKQDVTVKAIAKLTDALSLVFGYVYEKYDVRDFANEGVEQVGGANAGQTNIYLADNSMDYRAHMGSVTLKYRFGTGAKKG